MISNILDSAHRWLPASAGDCLLRVVRRAEVAGASEMLHHLGKEQTRKQLSENNRAGSPSRPPAWFPEHRWRSEHRSCYLKIVLEESQSIRNLAHSQDRFWQNGWVGCRTLCVLVSAGVEVCAWCPQSLTGVHFHSQGLLPNLTCLPFR